MARDIKLNTKLTGDASGIKRATGEAKGAVKGFQSSLKSMAGALAGAFAVTSIIRWTRNAIAAGSALSDAAFQAGVTVERFQVLEEVTRRAGSSSEDLRAALAQLRIRMGEASAEGGVMLQAFESLGISLDEIRDLSVDEMFERIGAQMNATSNSNESLNAAAEILGTRRLPKLIEVLNQAGIGLEKVESEMSNIVTTQEAMELDKLEDDFQSATEAAGRFWQKVVVGGKNVVDYFTKSGEMLREMWDTKNFKFIGPGDVLEQMGFEEYEAEQEKLWQDAEKLRKQDEAAEAERIQNEKAAKEKALQETAAAKDKLDEENHKKELARINKETDARRKAAQDLHEEKLGLASEAAQEIKDARQRIEKAQMPFSAMRNIGANVQGAGRIVTPEMKQAKLQEETNTILRRMDEKIAALDQSQPGVFK